MKTLSKLSLKDELDLLNEEEMKTLVGGNNGYGWCCFRDGECVLTGCTSDSHCKGWYGEGWCTS